MAFDFPSAPSNGAVYSPAGGPSYTFQNGVWLAVPPAAPLVPTALDNNIIVNPSIQHSQELTPGTVYTTVSAYIADQWMVSWNGPAAANLQTIAYTAALGATVPLGCIALTSTGTLYTAVTGNNYFGVVQYIEGMVASKLMWGTGSAIPAVLAFEIFSSMAGTFAVGFRSSNFDRSIIFPITIAAGEVNTWKRFTFVVPAISGGTFARNNTCGLELWFTVMTGPTFQAPSSGAWLNGNYIGLSGQSNLLSVASQTFYVRSIGLYPDPQGTGRAPFFTVPDFSTELSRCKRYWQRFRSDILSTAAGASYYHGVQYPYPVEMRVAPTLTNNADGSVVNVAACAFDTPTTYCCRLYMQATAAGTYYMTGRTATANARM